MPENIKIEGLNKVIPLTTGHDKELIVTDPIVKINDKSNENTDYEMLRAREMEYIKDNNVEEQIDYAGKGFGWNEIGWYQANEGVLDIKQYLQNNLDDLEIQIKYLGFPEESIVSLREKMKPLNAKIELPVSMKFYLGKSEIVTDFTLNFTKGKENDSYFLNSYTARLKDKENQQAQTFYINARNGFTANEAFNLLSGRSVNKDLTNKDGVTYNAWVKLKPSKQNTEFNESNIAVNNFLTHERLNLNFQIFSENYGYNLKESISELPIKELKSEELQKKLILLIKNCKFIFYK